MRYLFHLHTHDNFIPDDEPQSFASFAAARGYAIAAARDIMAEEVRCGKLCLGAAIHIENVKTGEMSYVPFVDALAITIDTAIPLSLPVASLAALTRAGAIRG